MRVYNPKTGQITIPLYDIGTIAAGFYIGYNEGKGIDTSQTLEYLTKYGPTAIAICVTPIILKAINMLGKWTNRKSMQDLHDENFEVIIQGKTKRYKDLSEEQRQELSTRIITNVKNLESKLQNPSYLKPTLISGTRTAVETIIGYTAGKIYSQIN